MRIKPFRIDEPTDNRVKEYLAKTPNMDYSKFVRQAIVELLDKKEKEHDELPANP